MDAFLRKRSVWKSAKVSRRSETSPRFRRSKASSRDNFERFFGVAIGVTTYHNLYRTSKCPTCALVFKNQRVTISGGMSNLTSAPALPAAAKNSLTSGEQSVYVGA